MFHLRDLYPPREEGELDSAEGGRVEPDGVRGDHRAELLIFKLKPQNHPFFLEIECFLITLVRFHRRARPAAECCSSSSFPPGGRTGRSRSKSGQSRPR